MAPNLRQNLNERFGTLSAGCTALDTTLQANVFIDPGIPGYYTQSLYLPLVLADDTVPAFEVVYVVGHDVNTNTATVVRAQEGTTARAWPAGTVVRAAPTVRDARQAFGTAEKNGLSNPHVGMGVTDADSGRVEFETMTQGWLGFTGAPPPNSNIVRYSGPQIQIADVPIPLPTTVAGATVGGPNIPSVSQFSSGMIFSDIKQPFPKGIVLAVLTTKIVGGSGVSFARADFCGLEKSPANLRLWFVCVNGDNNILPNGVTAVFSNVVWGM